MVGVINEKSGAQNLSFLFIFSKNQTGISCIAKKKLRCALVQKIRRLTL